MADPFGEYEGLSGSGNLREDIGQRFVAVHRKPILLAAMPFEVY